MTGQTFSFASWEWDVDAALAIVAAAPREPVLVSVPALARLLPLVPFDAEHAKTVDLAQPVLLAPYPDNELLAVDMVLPIDGWYRIYRAMTERLPELPAVTLTAAEAATLIRDRRRRTR